MVRHKSIFGYGVTTTPLVAFLNKQGEKLYIYDDRFNNVTIDDFGNTFLPSSAFESASSSMEILSPGIPPYHPLIQKAQHIISEYDYFDMLLNDEPQKPLNIWISGTNGKTTTTEITTLLLSPFGAKSGGNIGTPLATLYEEKAPVWVLETSSFSLHYTQKACPHIYALLPVREDHITWHGSFEHYVSDKLKPLTLMNAQSYAIIPDELSFHPMLQAYKGHLIIYKNSVDLAQKLDLPIKRIVFKEPFLLDALIALGIAKIGFKCEDIERLNLFKIGKHRIEEFYDAQNRLWVDDSKGTNVDATIEAIRRYADKHLIIILGGDDKGANLTPLFDFMQGKDICIYAIGSNEARLADFAKKYALPCVPSTTLQNAMELIKRERKSDDVVLLSPAAASLDQFDSYKQRGEIFVKLALQ